MGNVNAQIGLMLAWVMPFVAFAMLRPTQALVVTFVVGTLFLPERIAYTFTGLPELGKYELLSLSSLAGALAFHPQRVLRRPWLRGMELVVFVIVISGFATAWANRDPIRFAPGMRLYDAASPIFEDLVRLAIPFVLGRAFIRRPRDARVFMLGIVTWAVGYSVLVAFEAWYSPQLHKMVYGFLQHSWLQLRRFGGWRPMVFMPHGLALAAYYAAAAVCAAAAARAGARIFNQPARWVAWFLAGVLVMCKSLGALVQGALWFTVALFTSRRTQLTVAWVLAWIVLTYPLSRAFDLFPTRSLVQFANDISPKRGQSLEFRFENEDRLIRHVRQRPLLGWGGFGRAKAVNDGGPRVVVDGYWINRLSSRGVVGYAIYQLLLLVPVFQAHRRRRLLMRGREGYWVTGLTLVSVLFAIETIPNALYLTMPLVAAGGLSSTATRYRPSEAKAPGQEAPGEAPPTSPDSPHAQEKTFSDLLGRARSRR